MSGYKIISAIQAVLTIFLGVSVFDYTDYIGLNEAFFASPSDFWNMWALWAYILLVVGLLQLVKVFTVKEGT